MQTCPPKIIESTPLPGERRSWNHFLPPCIRAKTYYTAPPPSAVADADRNHHPGLGVHTAPSPLQCSGFAMHLFCFIFWSNAFSFCKNRLSFITTNYYYHHHHHHDHHHHQDHHLQQQHQHQHQWFIIVIRISIIISSSIINNIVKWLLLLNEYCSSNDNIRNSTNYSII